MEPMSQIYTDPVVVLDFQSLYPSMMIACNICYSTCFGKCKNPLSEKLGVRQYSANIKYFEKFNPKKWNLDFC